MQRIRFSKPVQSHIGADVLSEPSDLKNAHVDWAEGAVVANNQSELVSNVSATLNPGRKPHVPWNNSLISGGEEGIIAADSYNKYLYASKPGTGSGISVYPPDYPANSPDTAVPYISQVSHTVTNITGAQTNNEREGYLSYVIVPFNERGEAGAWRYYGTAFTYNYASQKKDGTWTIYLKPTITLNLTTVGCSYIEVYRTREGLKGRTRLENIITTQVDGRTYIEDRRVVEGFDSETISSEYLYLDRFEVETSGVTSSVAVLDEKTWHSPAAETVLLGHSDKNTMPTIDQMIDIGLVNADVVTAPTSTLQYSINVWDSPSSATFDCNAVTHSFTAPSGFSAKTMMMHQGVMLYGDVTWPTKMPAVASFASGADTVSFQYEYQIYNQKVYGPVLTVQNAERVLIAWQGEAALLMYNQAGNLLRRLVPNAQGMYVHSEAETDSITDSETANSVDIPVRSFWTYVSGISYSGTPGATTQSSTSSISEDNVVFMSETYRPLEVTFEQFYLPDNSACRALTPARIEEDESITDYHGYAFTDRSVFMWTRRNRDVQIEYIEQTIGLKYNPFNQGMVAPIRGGVVFAGTNNGLYIMSGRRIRRIDALLKKWTTIYDVAYNAFDSEIAVLTNTGIWFYDTEVLNGIYKHVDITGNTSMSLSYLGATIEDIDLNHILLHDENPGGNDKFLEYLSAKETDTSVTTQPIRIGEQSRISELRVDHDRGPNVRTYSITDTTNVVNLTGSGDSVFNEEDVGTSIKLEGAGVAAANLDAVITQYNSPTQVLINTSASTTQSGKQALWPVVNIKHSFRSPELYEKTFFTYPWAKRFPRGYGIEHTLEVQNFQTLRELHISMREE